MLEYLEDYQIGEGEDLVSFVTRISADIYNTEKHINEIYGSGMDPRWKEMGVDSMFFSEENEQQQYMFFGTDEGMLHLMLHNPTEFRKIQELRGNVPGSGNIWDLMHIQALGKGQTIPNINW